MEGRSAHMEGWDDYRQHFSTGLQGMIASDREGATLTPADAFDRWIRLTAEARDRGRTLYFVGNGGSAMIASHMAVDACKNGGLKATAFNDAAMLTAIGNDIGFEDIFALPLARTGQAGDLLISISSSGNSPNIVRALETGRRAGMHLITLSGKRPDNQSRALGDVNFYVPADRYGWVESAHQVIIHYWFDQYLNLYGTGAL